MVFIGQMKFAIKEYGRTIDVMSQKSINKMYSKKIPFVISYVKSDKAGGGRQNVVRETSETLLACVSKRFLPRYVVRYQNTHALPNGIHYFK